MEQRQRIFTGRNLVSGQYMWFEHANVIVNRIPDPTEHDKLKISQVVCLGYIAFQRPAFLSFYCTMIMKPILMRIVVSISLC